MSRLRFEGRYKVIYLSELLRREEASTLMLGRRSIIYYLIIAGCFVLQRLSVWTTEAIPKGTRFGPLIGRHDNVDVISLSLAMKSKHAWLVNCIFFARQR